MRTLTRITTLLAAIAVLGLVAAACQETQLVGLAPEFNIIWPEDQGYVAGDLPESMLAFGEVTTGQIAEIDLQMSNPGTAGLDVCGTYLARVTFDEDGALASEEIIETNPELASSGPGEMLLEDGQVLGFALRFTPLYGEALAADLHLVIKHELNWNCSDDSGSGLYIPIAGEGFGDPIPDIHSDPSQVEFGEVEVGDSSTIHDVRVSNLGPGLLEIGNVGLADSTHFVIVEESVGGAQLEQSGSEMLSVQFVPQGEGTHSTELLIDSNDPDENPYSLLLVGTGNGTPLGKGPQAVCAPDYDSAPLETEFFDGTGSWDPDGLSLTYQWVLTPPPGSAAELSSYSIAGPSIFLDLAGDYEGELTVTNSNAQSSSCTQTIHAIPNENFRVELYWAQTDDMDLHLLQPASQGWAIPHFPPGDCYYANMNPDWGVSGVSDDNPSLDLDDIPGTGPENININEPALAPYDGWYQVFVHDYTGSTTDTTGANAVTVNIYLNGVLEETYNFNITGDGDDYYVAKIHWPSGQIVACNGLGGCP
jgi:hypothetical protein